MQQEVIIDAEWEEIPPKKKASERGKIFVVCCAYLTLLFISMTIFVMAWSIM